MVFYWSLSVSKYTELFSEFWKISIILSLGWSWLALSFLTLPVLVPIIWWLHQATITIGITVTFIFHICFFFSSLTRSMYLSFFQFYPVVSRNSKVCYLAGSLFYVLFLSITRSGRLAEFRYPFVPKNPREVYASHFSGQNLSCAYTIYSYSQIQTSCTIPSESPSPSRDV